MEHNCREKYWQASSSNYPFVHEHKPHFGQIWAAEQMLSLLEGSDLIRYELDGSHDYRGSQLIQDRYSLRCLAQYLGPIVDGIEQISGQVEVEMNSVTDNPLIDVKNQASYHGGNFLGQYIGTGMDSLRALLDVADLRYETESIDVRSF